jgi:DNA-binding IclR family transcriptional regulator
VGGRLPLYTTGVGKVLLAHSPQDLVARVIAQGLVPHASRTIVDPARLLDDLELTRRRGFSVTRDEMTDGSVSVGAPIFGPDQQVVAALSVVVAARIRDPQRLAPPVRTAARGLTRQVIDSWDRLESLVPAAMLAYRPAAERIDG